MRAVSGLTWLNMGHCFDFFCIVADSVEMAVHCTRVGIVLF